MSKPFPDDFLWGASTAAHQVEGGTHNQWSEWEQANAERLATTAERRNGWMPAWPDVKQQAQDPDNYISGDGVDHYNLYKEDFALLHKLNMNAFRFGIEWSRLEPAPGQWNEAEFAHYRRYFADIIAAKIEPVVSLWHWTMPVWFTNQGGMARRRNLQHWRRYVRKLAEELDWSDITYVLTINEANTYSGLSYGSGEWPPQHKNFAESLYVYYNLVSAHRIAVEELRRVWPHLRFGSAHQCNAVLPARKGKLTDWLMARVQAYYWNWWYLNRINKTQDFVGINYYFTDYRRGLQLLPKNPTEPVNDLGWYMNPAGLESVITEAWRRYKKPIIITENGVADHKDQYRQWWIDETIAAMQRSMQQGVQLFGYLHWSLLDNFEWASGYWPQFGLVTVNRKTMKRSIRPSAIHLAKRIVALSKKRRSHP